MEDRSSWKEAQALIDVGRYFHDRGWSVGTSSNYSIVLQKSPLKLLLTASGMDKGRLTGNDFVVVDETGKAIDPADPKPSAETMIHVVLGKLPGVGAILHTHSVWGTILSDLYHAGDGFEIEGYEMLKGLTGVPTHEHKQWVTIFENTQDIAALSRDVEKKLADPRKPLTHGFLIRRHGLYTWGRDIEEARRQIEIFEFLFEVLYRRLALGAR